MDHLLVVASADGIAEGTLQALRLAGWRVTQTADVVSAKRLLQKADIAVVMVDLAKNSVSDRLKVLRFVQEFCPNTMVIMLHSGTDQLAHANGGRLAQRLDRVGDMQPQAQKQTLLDQYHLTPAQKRIAELVAQAYPNREIARRLRIKEQSVRNQLSQVFRKTGIWNRVELALLLGGKGAAAQQTVRELEQAEIPSPSNGPVHDSVTVDAR
jgi:DNA-binding NarL/FixJ family response regulator